MVLELEVVSSLPLSLITCSYWREGKSPVRIEVVTLVVTSPSYLSVIDKMLTLVLTSPSYITVLHKMLT